MGGLFALFGLFGLLWRDELTFDLRDRRFHRRRGLWPAAATRSSGLDGLEGLVLVEDLGHHRGKPTVEWEVWLHFRGDEPAVRVLEARSEEEARTGADELARRLGVEVAEGHRPD